MCRSYKPQPQPKNPQPYFESEEPKLGDAVWIKAQQGSLTSAHVIRVIPRQYRQDFDFVAVPFDEDEPYMCQIRESYKYEGMKAKYHRAANKWIEKKQKVTPSKWEEIIHDDECQSCGRPGEQIMCDSCIASYHTYCLEINVNDLDQAWYCPVCWEYFQPSKQNNLPTSVSTSSDNHSRNSSSKTTPSTSHPKPLAQKRPPKKRQRLSEQGTVSFNISSASSALSPLSSPSYSPARNCSVPSPPPRNNNASNRKGSLFSKDSNTTGKNKKMVNHFNHIHKNNNNNNNNNNNTNNNEINTERQTLKETKHENHSLEIHNTISSSVWDLSCSSPSSTQTNESNQDITHHENDPQYSLNSFTISNEANQITHHNDNNTDLHSNDAFSLSLSSHPTPLSLSSPSASPSSSASSASSSSSSSPFLFSPTSIRKEGIELLARAQSIPEHQEPATIVCKKYGDDIENASPLHIPYDNLSITTICQKIKSLWHMKHDCRVKLLLVTRNGQLISVRDSNFLKNCAGPLVFEFKTC